MMIWSTLYSSNLIYFMCITITILATVIQETVADGLEKQIRYRVYKDGQPDMYHQGFIDNEGLQTLEKSEYYNKNKPVIIVFHGLNQGADKDLIKKIINAFRSSGHHREYNIMAMHLPEMFAMVWHTAFGTKGLYMLKSVGEQIGKFLRDVCEKELTSPDKISMIGVYLGAHVAAYASRNIKYKDTQVQFIAGLDPAGAGWELVLGLITPLNYRDAKIVHILHTNTIHYPNSYMHGTADFIFNGGRAQPGCFFEGFGCSHERSVLYFIESVMNSNAFGSRKCSNIGLFNTCTCNWNAMKPLKFPPDYFSYGFYPGGGPVKFYVRTESRSPYSMGNSGTKCFVQPVKVAKTIWKRLWGK